VDALHAPARLHASALVRSFGRAPGGYGGHRGIRGVPQGGPLRIQPKEWALLSLGFDPEAQRARNASETHLKASIFTHEPSSSWALKGRSNTRTRHSVLMGRSQAVRQR